MTDISREEALAHFGVKGMKWGVRKAATAMKPQNIATRKTEKRIKAHTKALTGKGITGKLALADKYTWGGNGRFEGYHNKKISQLERSVERIENGELIARTILFGPVKSRIPKE